MEESISARPKVAIACQGGGSYAAFGAGVLMRLLEPEQRQRYQLVALSGTSGGAISAALVWRGLVASGPDEARERCARFWRALEAHELDTPRYLFSSWDVWSARTPVLVSAMPYVAEPFAQAALRQMLREHLELEQLTPDRALRAQPKLFVAATDVLNGDRVIFQGESLSLEQVMASAAVPPMFRAVSAAGHWCWDGIFSTNAPVREFTDIDEVPDEIWIVQVIPQRRVREPRTLREIKDRTNEISGNLSLSQELYFIDRINHLLEGHPSLRERYRRIRLRIVQLDDGQQDGPLDIPSKLDRRRGFVERLIEAGLTRADWFFDARSDWPRENSLPPRSVVVPP
jgi:NTE family protein